MTSFSKTIICGRLGKDPDVRYTADGLAVAKLSVATSEKWKDKKTNEYQEVTEWHKVVLFGKQAEFIAKYSKKGDMVLVDGKNKTQKWQAKDGTDRYTTEINGDSIKLLTTKSSNKSSGDSEINDAEAAIEDDDIPF